MGENCSRRRCRWIGVAMILSWMVASPAAAGEPKASVSDLKTSADFEAVMGAFYQIEKRIRDGDKSLRQPLLEMVAHDPTSPTVFGALLLLRNGLATVEDLRPYRVRIFDAMNQLWDKKEVPSHPFRRELLYRMRHPEAKADDIPTAEKTYVEMLRDNKIWADAAWAEGYIDSCIKAFPDEGIALLKRALRDPDRQARQIAFLDLTQRLGPDKLATFEPYVDALVESLRSDRMNWHNWLANAEFGAAVLFRIKPFPREKLAASFKGEDAQGDLVTVAILSARAPDAVTDAMIAYCADQMKSDGAEMNGEVAFHVLKSLGPRAHPALRRALAGNDSQQIALAVIALADAKALPKDLDAERLLDKMVKPDGPVSRYAVPEAALILAKRARPWVRRMAAQAKPTKTNTRFFDTLLNPASDAGDIEAAFGPPSVCYRRNVPMSDRLIEYLSPQGYEEYLEMFKKGILFQHY